MIRSFANTLLILNSPRAALWAARKTLQTVYSSRRGLIPPRQAAFSGDSRAGEGARWPEAELALGKPQTAVAEELHRKGIGTYV